MRTPCASFDRGGLEVFDADLPSFRAALARESHTLKRALTDPGILSGIGNAYSDEILHRARLSPVKLTTQLSDEETARLFDACRATLADWIDRLRAEAGAAFPKASPPSAPDMAVHGRYGKPCPVCGSPSSASSAPTTRPTTAPAARRAAASSPTAPCRDCSRKTGRARSKSWKTAAARRGRRRACARGWRLCMLGRCATSRR